jgi:uncharacterized membrane protein
MEFTPVILIHLFAALGAIVIGGVTLTLKKGTSLHRLFGRTWVILMVLAALVSFGIKSSGHFSWIHLLSVSSLVALGASIYAVITGRISAHRRGMIFTYISLVIAGAFTLLPGRRLGHLVWHTVGLV